MPLIGEMYSVVPIKANRMSTISYVWWTPWSYDLAIFQWQFFLSTFFWSDPPYTGLYGSVYFWSALLTIFGFLSVLKYGKRAIHRALFCTLGMEFVFWAGYWLGSTLKEDLTTRYRTTVLFYVLFCVIWSFMLLVYGNITFNKTHAMRRPKETERRLHRGD